MNPTGSLYLYLDTVDSPHQLFYANLNGSNDSQSYTLNTASLALGTHTLIAKYGGDSNFNAAQVQATITIDNPKQDVTLTVTASPTEAKQGQPISVTITVA